MPPTPQSTVARTFFGAALGLATVLGIAIKLAIQLGEEWTEIIIVSAVAVCIFIIAVLWWSRRQEHRRYLALLDRAAIQRELREREQRLIEAERAAAANEAPTPLNDSDNRT